MAYILLMGISKIKFTDMDIFILSLIYCKG